jgi:hypothetical protein
MQLHRILDPPAYSLTNLRKSSMNYVEQDSYGMYRASDSNGPGPRLMGADTLMGNDVYNRQDEDLGDIKEIMLDVPGGRISYAVLSFGGLLGMGEKLFAVPWEALPLDTESKRFTWMCPRTDWRVLPDLTRTNGPTCQIKPGPKTSVPIAAPRRPSCEILSAI